MVSCRIFKSITVISCIVFLFFNFSFVLVGYWNPKAHAAGQLIVVDHRNTRLSEVTLTSINKAKTDLHIAYGHTSHGSQLIDGMTGLTTFGGAPYPGSTYAWNDGPKAGALDIDDYAFTGAFDLGNPNFTAWESATRTYLAANPDVNVIIWSWCGEVSTATSANINTYLSLMNGLEISYPHVKFVYMTGHTDGGGLTGNLHLRNQQIRDYVLANNKILYDFEDIESYNPDGVYFGDRQVHDSCEYTIGASHGNWCIEWQNSHTAGIDWYNSNSAHSQPLNANLKAYAAWSLWTKLAEAGSTGTTLKADFSKNGIVGSEDFTILKNNWGRTNADSYTGDANGDKIVNIYDLSALAYEW